MDKPHQLTKQQSSKQLLKTLHDSPALPAFIKTLNAPVLQRLIDHVGLRDAGALVALTTTQQLREVFEVALWKTLIPGQAEAPRPEMFLEWLDVLLEVSPAFAAQRLIELGGDFVVLHIGQLIRVREQGFDGPDPDVDFSDDVDVEVQEAFDSYIVNPIHEDEWDSVRTTLVELGNEDASFLQHVLARCCPTVSTSFIVSDGEELLRDETHAREQRRERSGFVTPQMATRFLSAAKQASIEDLVALRNYDDVSHRYFEQLTTAANEAATTVTRGSTQTDPPSEANAHLQDDDQEASPISGTQRRALEAALVRAEIIRNDPPPLLLSGPEDSREPTIALQSHLDRLQVRHPAMFSARLGELIFLANVLMAGSWYQNARFSEPDAAQAALACANLGLEYLLKQQHLNAATRTDFIEETLAEPPGIVRLFQIGWQLTQALPLRCANALLDTLRADNVRNQLKHKRWMLEEIESAINDPDLISLIRQGEFEDVSDNLVMLTLILDPRACQCLRILIVDFPRYPLQLDVGLQHATSATRESQYLKSMRQLETIEAFLDDLDGLLKI